MSVQRILCLGGGPAGLYTALLMKKADPRRVVRVVERNQPGDTFGWGVVFSDQTLGNLEAADPETAAEVVGAFNRWDDIDVHFKGRTVTSGGHGFCGIGRKRLLNILQERCEALDVELAYDDEVARPHCGARIRGRSGRGGRRTQQPHPRPLRGNLRTGRGAAAMPLRLAGHA